MTTPTELHRPTDLTRERRGLFVSGSLGIIVCVGVSLAGQLLLPQFLAFPVDFISRLQFWAQTQIFLFVWVVLGIGWVSRTRRRSLEDISGSAFGPPSVRLRIPVAFLQNSLEQAVVASAAQLALITQLEGPQLALIVSATVLFCIGRIAFVAGYHNGAPGRAFGFVLTFLPTLIGYVLILALLVRPFIPAFG